MSDGRVFKKEFPVAIEIMDTLISRMFSCFEQFKAAPFDDWVIIEMQEIIKMKKDLDEVFCSADRKLLDMAKLLNG